MTSCLSLLMHAYTLKTRCVEFCTSGRGCVWVMHDFCQRVILTLNVAGASVLRPPVSLSLSLSRCGLCVLVLSREGDFSFSRKMQITCQFPLHWWLKLTDNCFVASESGKVLWGKLEVWVFGLRNGIRCKFSFQTCRLGENFEWMEFFLADEVGDRNTFACARSLEKEFTDWRGVLKATSRTSKIGSYRDCSETV